MYALQVIAGLLGLSFLVFIHELGHFSVAKFFGVRVRAFSIGFGKKLIKWRRGETEYCISAIPFGGYVAMAGENPSEVENRGPQPGDFSLQPVRVRAAIALAGPLVNIVFAYFLLAGLYMVGVQEPLRNKLVVGMVETESAGASAGIRKGDTVVSINGEPARGWENFRETVGTSLKTELTLGVKRGNELLSVNLQPDEYENMGVGYSGVHPGSRIVTYQEPVQDSPAEKAGIKQGDTIIQVGKRLVSSPRDVMEPIKASEGIAVPIVVKRLDDTLNFQIEPQFNTEHQRYMIGIQMGMVSMDAYHTVRRGFLESFSKAGTKSVEMATSIFRYLGKLFQGEIKLKALSGPVGIVPIIGLSFLESPGKMLMLIALISINLGVMNLLPLAITDGGILMFLAIESIRRKPLSLALQTRIQQFATAFFIAFFFYITIQDFSRFSLFFPD